MMSNVLQRTLHHLLATMELVPRSNALHRRIGAWASDCLGDQQVASKKERAYRFFEEALELAQAAGLSQEEAAEMLKVTYGRSPGFIEEEVADVRIALSVLCVPYDIDPEIVTERKLAECMANSDIIRERQKRKRFRDPTV